MAEQSSLRESRFERRIVRERRYEGRSQYLGAFGLGGAFIAVGIISILLNIFSCRIYRPSIMGLLYVYSGVLYYYWWYCDLYPG